MRYISILAGLIVALLVSFGCTSATKSGNAGAGSDVSYEGSAMGYRGMIRVRVSMEQGTITDITVIESREDRAIGGAAIEDLTDMVLMYNTTEIDAISGATETSRGFLEAIENAIMNQ